MNLVEDVQLYTVNCKHKGKQSYPLQRSNQAAEAASRATLQTRLKII